MKTFILFYLSFIFGVPAFSKSVVDTIPPSIVTIINIGVNQTDIFFTEPIEQSSAENPQHYRLFQSGNNPTYVIRDNSNPALVHLVFFDSFSERVNYDVVVTGISDLSSNIMNDTTVKFVLYKPMPYDIVIDEIMADPTPVNGMPDAEWLELRNVSPFEINLSGWRIAKSTGKSGPIRSLILKPDSLLVICSSGSVTELSPFCNAISVTSFPSLSNTEDLIILLSPDEKTIHAVNYTDDWYKNEYKKQGGWSLEMIDINNPCTGFENWSSSIHITGATASRVNSIDAMNIDESSPKLMRVFAIDSLHLELYFNEPMDSMEALNVNHFHIDHGIGSPISVSPEAPLFDRMKITLPTSILRNKIYNITVNGLKDCISNEIAIYNTVRFGIDEFPDSFDVVVNEILFNPKNDGVDFVELYNRSDKIINLKNIHVSNLNSSGSIDNIVSIPDVGYLLFPEEYIVVTTNPAIIKRDYISNHPENIIPLSAFPSFNDDEGNVVLLNEQGSILDMVSYKDDWHFKLINDKEGISLERIDYNGNSQDENNWHSASATAGFGTPADKNSQSTENELLKGEVNISPKIISPDNDGKDDVAKIYYSFAEPGNIANICVYDLLGRVVKHLQINSLCGITGYYRWDGLNDANKKLISGNYIIYTEVFNLKGRVIKFKNIIAVKS